MSRLGENKSRVKVVDEMKVLVQAIFTLVMFSVVYSSSCTLPLSVLLALPFPLTTTFMQIILSCSSLFTHSTLTQAFLTFKTLFNTSLPGWLLIFLLLAPLRLNSCSSDSKANSSKYTTLHLISPTLLETLALSLTNMEHLTFSDQITSLQSLLLSHSSTLLYPALPWFLNCL